jgi:hypothetical protein
MAVAGSSSGAHVRELTSAASASRMLSATAVLRSARRRILRITCRRKRDALSYLPDSPSNICRGAGSLRVRLFPGAKNDHERKKPRSPDPNDVRRAREQHDQVVGLVAVGEQHVPNSDVAFAAVPAQYSKLGRIQDRRTPPEARPCDRRCRREVPRQPQEQWFAGRLLPCPSDPPSGRPRI